MGGVYLRWSTPWPDSVGGLPKVGYPQQGYPSQVSWGYLRLGTLLQGYLPAKSDRGTQGGVIPAGVPPTRFNGGYLRRGTPLAGVPPWPGLMGVPKVGYPLAGVPQTWPGYPPPRCGQTDGWMDGQICAKT